MRCRCCDRLLTDFEATRKNAIDHQFVDLCKVCFEDVKGLFPVIERKDLITESDLDLDGDDDGLECTDTEAVIDYIDNYRDNYDS
jgi:hypothetical protein